MSQSGILSLSALRQRAEVTKWSKVVILASRAREEQEEQELRLPPPESTSSVINGQVDRQLSKHLSFLIFTPLSDPRRRPEER